MKKNLLCLFIFASAFSFGQINYSKQNINLISLSTPNFGVGGDDSRLYSGCWGWYQQTKNKEYAICGASNGTYFMDITNPATPSVSAYVPGKLGCTWREMKTYKNYCYIISDDPKPNKFQIVDMQYLPDSVHVVHEGTQYFEHSHTIWIDNDKMYVGSVTYTTGFSSMNVYSLATPSVPVLLRSLGSDIPSPIINAVHDMFVRNDTVYASCGNEGLYVLKFNTSTNTFSQLGSYTGYSNGVAYNHSSSLTKDGKHLIFCDEVPAALPIRIVDVQNLSNIQPIQQFKPFGNTTPHNPYIVGSDYAVVSCYQDGIYIYNISNPGNATVVGYFDTHPQGGANTGTYINTDYRGNWGAYPWLPSKIIIAQDMQNGVFLLDASPAFSQGVGMPTNRLNSEALSIYPNPAKGQVNFRYNSNDPFTMEIQNVLGQICFQRKYMSAINENIDLSFLESGTYMVSIKEKTKTVNKKLIIYN